VLSRGRPSHIAGFGIDVLGRAVRSLNLAWLSVMNTATEPDVRASPISRVARTWLAVREPVIVDQHLVMFGIDFDGSISVVTAAAAGGRSFNSTMMDSAVLSEDSRTRA